MYLLEELPKELGAVKILDYNQTDMTALAKSSEFVTDVKNMTVGTPLTIVSLVGKTPEEVQQIMNAQDQRLDGKKVSKIMVEATPEEHAALINSLTSPRRNVKLRIMCSYKVRDRIRAI